jgi:PTS system ascorbate-specific IIA component
MSVGILPLTHKGIGAKLIAVTEAICKQIMPGSDLMSVPSNLKPEALGKYAHLIPDAMLAGNRGDAVLVLTDVFDVTPDNLARHFSRECDARIVSGINLPMLLRVLNYARQSLEELRQTALNGSRNGVKQDRE